MICSGCSAPLRDSDSRCPSCGRIPVSSELTEATTVAPPLTSEDMEFLPGSRIADRYTIVEKAGQGGMAMVYKAIDNALGLQVALKFIRPERAGIAAFIERLKEEVRLSRQITHDNVCRVHDLGEIRGIHYLSMEWVEGETLRRLLRQTGILELDKALEIAHEIALALEAAHAKGIIHRDLKPENVMIDARGKIFVMDFGIAVGPGPAEDREFARGAGTPAYMSPEQTRGVALDPRSDLYALGLILLEMLTGKLHAPGAPPPVIRSAKLRRHIEPVLHRLLAEEREDRFNSAAMAAGELQKLREKLFGQSTGLEKVETRRHWRTLQRTAGIAAPLLLAAGVTYLVTQPCSPPPPPPAAFYDRGLHYLRDEGDTLRSLGDATQMFHRVLESDPNMAAAWAGLGEAYWYRYREAKETVIRDEAAEAVAKSLRLSPDLPEAHQARGVGLYVQGDYKGARIEFEKALAKRPDFDAALEWLGNTCRVLGDYRRAQESLQAAIKLKPRNFHHHIALGLFYEVNSEYDAAEQAYRKALELKPDSPWAANNLGAMYLYLGRYGDAVDSFLRAMKTEEQGTARSNLGTAYYFMGKYQEAAENYQLATVREPRSAENWGNLGDALTMLGKTREGVQAFRQAVLLQREEVAGRPQDALAHARLGRYCAKAGDMTCAEEEGARAAGMQPGDTRITFMNAVIYCAAGKEQEALDWLEKAVKLGLTRVEIENEPFLSPLRDKERYRRILGLAS